MRERYFEAKSKFLPLRNAWIKNSKAVAIAEFEEEQATQYAGALCKGRTSSESF